MVGVKHLTICILFLWIETFRSLEYLYLKLDLRTCKAYIHDLIEQRPMLNLIVKAELSKRDKITRRLIIKQLRSCLSFTGKTFLPPETH